MSIRESDVFGLITDLAAKAPLVSPNFTGIVTVGTPGTFVAPSGNITFYGTSITAGTGATSSPLRYSTLTAAALGLTEINLGVSAQVVEQRTPPGGTNNFISNQATVTTYSAGTTKWLVIETGPNDFNQGYTAYNPTNYATDLTSFVNYCISTKGWPANKILILSNSYIAPSQYGTVGTGGVTLTSVNYQAFITATLGVATALGTLYFDVFNWLGNRGGIFLLSDSLHPNNLGHATQSNGLLSVLAPGTVYSSATNPLNVNGITETAFLKLDSNNTIVDGSLILGKDSSGNVGVATGLPANFRTLGTFYLGGQNIQTGATIPTGVTIGSNDIILRKDVKIIGSFDGNNSLSTYLKMCSGTVGTEFHTNYSQGTHRFFVTSSDKLGLSIQPNASIFVGDGTGDGTFSANGDIVIGYGSKLMAAQAGGYGAFEPFAAAMTNIRNAWGTGRINFYNSGGTNAAQVQTAQLNEHGRLTLQEGGTFTDNPIARIAINSTAEGFLLPRMTTAQRDAMGFVLNNIGLTAGSGYTSAPTATVTGGGGTGCVITLGVSGGAINSVILTNPGTGYTSIPTVTVTGGGGTGGVVSIFAISLTGNTGLLIFNTTVGEFQYFNGTQWVGFGMTVADATATPYTKSTINTAYPNATIGFKVIADTAGFTYIKKDNSSTGNWSVIVSSQLT